MIVDKIENYKLYNTGKKFEDAFKFLTGSSIGELPSGKYNINGDEVFALINDYETVPAAEKYLEGHRKYIDLQYVFSGEELIGYSPLGNQKVISGYNEEKDYFLAEGEASFLLLKEKMFAIFYPGDLHMPGISVSGKMGIRKVVVKIAV